MAEQEATEETPPPGSPIYYKKTVGHANMTGELFEVKMILLLFLRGINETAGFYLASNVEGAGAFDDIIFQYKARSTEYTARGGVFSGPSVGPSTPVIKTCFVQLKSKQLKQLSLALLTSLKGDFSLFKYYTDFCEIQGRMKNATVSDGVLFSGNFEDTLFVLYTNATMKKDLTESEKIKKCNHPDRAILATTARDDFIINYCDIDDIKTPTDTTSLHQEFLEKLVIYSGQANEEELDTIIRDEIKKVLKTSDDVSERIRKELTAKIQYWWRKSYYILTEMSDLWKDAVDSCITQINDYIMIKLQRMDVIYSDEEVNTFYLSIESIDGAPVIVNTCDTELTMLKIRQTLEGSSTRFIMVSETLFKERKAEVLALWTTVWCDILVIECTSEQEVVNAVGECRQASDKWLVLVKGGFHFSAENLKVTRDSFSFTQLDEDSQHKLKNMRIHFEGSEITLGVVIQCRPDVVTTAVLHELLSGGDDIEIGRQVSIPYYISRSIERCDYLRHGALNKHSEEHFIISNISAKDILSILPRGEEAIKYSSDVSELTGRHHFLFADETFSERDFEGLAARFGNNILHWLEFEVGRLRWRLTHKDIGFIQRNLDTEHRSIYTDRHFMAHERVVLVTAEPGMGKSTFVKHLEQDIRRNFPSLCVLRINLNDTTKLLETTNNFSNIDTTIDFLVSAYSIYVTQQESLAAELQRRLRKSFESTVLLLDGFDEICPVYFDKVISLLQCVLRTKIHKLWITARKAVRPELEKALSVISYTLKPFTRDEQRDFLMRYWSLTLPNTELTEKMTEFADKLLRFTSESIHDHEQEFTGIPLQSYMLAESFNDKMKHFVLEQCHDLPIRLNLLELYELFIEQKERLYHKDKLKADPTNAALLVEREAQRKSFLKKHKKAAFLSLLSKREMKTLKFECKDEKKFFEDLEKGYEKRGIIDGVLNGKPCFIHRTFAEYFLALWLTEHVEDARTFIQSNFFTVNYETIRYFFDSILAKGFEFHMAVLSGNVERIQRSMREGVFDINRVDRGGRSALHLAGSYADTYGSQGRSRARIRLLLDHKADMTIKDYILGWRPLRYADATSLWGNIDVLISGSYDADDLVNTTQNICNGGMLCEVTRQGYTNVLRFVFDCNVDVNIVARSEQRWTLLHIAADADNCDSLRFLLERGADVTAWDLSYKHPLHVASARGHSLAVRLLVENGADVAAWDREHATPLHAAALRGHAEVVRYLSGCAGVNVMARNDDLLTPLMLATMKKFQDIVEILKARGAYT